MTEVVISVGRLSAEGSATYSVWHVTEAVATKVESYLGTPVADVLESTELFSKRILLGQDDESVVIRYDLGEQP